MLRSYIPLLEVATDLIDKNLHDLSALIQESLDDPVPSEEDRATLNDFAIDILIVGISAHLSLISNVVDKNILTLADRGFLQEKLLTSSQNGTMTQIAGREETGECLDKLFAGVLKKLT